MKKRMRKLFTSFVFSAGMILASCLTVFASEIKLNPETLDRVKNLDERDVLFPEGNELFYDIGESFSLNQLYESMRKYGFNLEWYADEAVYAIVMGDENLRLGVLWDEWAEGLDEDESIRNAQIPNNAVFEVYFGDTYNETTQTWMQDRIATAEAMIEKIEYINNGGGIARTAKKNGWLFEDGAWRYYENDVRVVNGWKNIDDKWYYFKDDASMVHSCLFEVDGKIYSFSTEGAIDYGWQERNPGDGNHWYYFDMESDSKGAALTGRKDGIGFDSYKYFFWTDGYTDQNGIGHAKGSLAIGSDASDQWILKDGTPLYVADKDGHLYTNTEKKLNGAEYTIDENGNVLPKLVKPYRYTDKNHTGPYADYVVVSGFDSKFVTTQTGDTNCTATCDFLVGKITGQLSPDTSYKQVESEIWSGLALWKYCDRTVTGSNGWGKNTDRKLREIYKRI